MQEGGKEDAPETVQLPGADAKLIEALGKNEPVDGLQQPQQPGPEIQGAMARAPVPRLVRTCGAF